MRRALHPVDVVITAYFVIMTVIVILGGASWWFVAIGAAIVGVDWLLAWLSHARDSRGVRFLHYWYPVVAVLGAFLELKYIVPAVHNFDDRRYDLALAALDERWFGGVLELCRKAAWPPLVDALHLCYWSYFPLPIVLGIGLWRRGEFVRFRQVVTTLLCAWYLSYLGYVFVPAVGPHHVVDGPRDPAFDGWVVGGVLHKYLMFLEGTMPDAFPSGHALIAMVALLLAWKHHRTLFWWLLPIGTGLWLSTMALRYHYVVDVVGSIAVMPLAFILGKVVFERWERGNPGPPTEVRTR